MAGWKAHAGLPPLQVCKLQSCVSNLGACMHARQQHRDGTQHCSIVPRPHPNNATLRGYPSAHLLQRARCKHLSVCHLGCEAQQRLQAVKERAAACVRSPLLLWHLAAPTAWGGVHRRRELAHAGRTSGARQRRPQPRQRLQLGWDAMAGGVAEKASCRRQASTRAGGTGAIAPSPGRCPPPPSCNGRGRSNRD